MLRGDVPNQLLDDHRLADAGAAEDADLAAALEGGDQVDDLDACLEDLELRLHVLERGRVAVDREQLLGLHRALAINGMAEYVEDAPQRHLADGDPDRPAGVDRFQAAGEPIGRGHGDRPHPVVAQVLLHLDNQGAVTVLPLAGPLDLEGVVDGGQLVLRELHVHDGPRDLDHRSIGHRSFMRSLLAEGFRPGGDLDHLAGDGRLPRLVVDERQVVYQLVGIVGGAAHCHHARALF